MWRGETASRVNTECNLVHTYPVTGGCYQQVLQSCTEMVHDPLVKYLFKISGNLMIQITGLDKVMSQGAFQICFLWFYTLFTQASQQTFTDHQPVHQCFKMQTLSRHWTPLVLFYWLAELSNSDTAAGSENRQVKPGKWEVCKFKWSDLLLKCHVVRSPSPPPPPRQFSDIHTYNVVL